MSQTDRDRWDAKYAVSGAGSSILNPPEEWLVRHVQSLPTGHALDLACGLGHNAIWLAQQGWAVTGIDISPVGLAIAENMAIAAGQPSIDWVAADLESFELPPSSYDLILVFRYLERVWIPRQIESALRPGGLLIYETFSRGQLARHDNHLRNPLFTLEAGELPRLFPSLSIEQYEEVDTPERSVTRLIAKRK